MGKNGYNGLLLEVNLSSGKIEKKNIPEADIKNFIGGRGLGMKILWDKCTKPGVDPLSPENPLMFMKQVVLFHFHLEDYVPCVTVKVKNQ